MSGKRAREARRTNQDRKTLSLQQNLESIVRPNGPFTVFDPQLVATYKGVRPQIDDLLLGDDGLLRLLPAAVYHEIPRAFLQIWAFEMGYHLFPTVELAGWLREEIGGAPAIEICAGAGILGRELGVPCIDWDVYHRFTDARLRYDLHRQPSPALGPHCEQVEASEAVLKYKPQVVFGGYVTQRVYPGEPTTMAGSVYGVDERAITRCVRKYIVVGSRAVHGGKKIARSMTRSLSPTWVVTRTSKPEDVGIFIWDNPAPEPAEQVFRKVERKASAPGPASEASSSVAPTGAGHGQPISRMLR